MTTNTNNDQALVTTNNRSAQLMQLRDRMEAGDSRPGAIVPHTFAEVQAMCQALSASDLVPKAYKDRPQDMAIVIMSGAELRLAPMASLRLYHVIEGTPRLSAEGIRAIILDSPECEYFEFAESSEKRSRWIGKRPGRPEKEIVWTIERAARAGLASKPNWKDPESMLNARASMQLGRLLWPNIVAGLISREEAADGDAIDVQFTERPAFVAPPRDPDPIPEEKNPPVRARARSAATAPEVPTSRGTPSPSVSAAASRPSPAPSSSASSSPSSAAETDEPRAAASAKLDAAIAAVEQKFTAREIAAVPTPAAAAAPPAAESGSPMSTATESGASSTAAPPGEDFGADDPVDREPERTIEGFNAWLRGCKSRQELEASKRPWIDWSASVKGPDGKPLYPRGSKEMVAMTAAYSARKAELP